MQQLIEKIKTTEITEYTLFIVHPEDNTMEIPEYGYYVGDSVTDNPKAVSRIVSCSNATLQRSSNKDAEELVNSTLEMAKQYIEDVTEQEFKDRLLNITSTHSCREGSLYNFELPEGYYIDLSC